MIPEYLFETRPSPKYVPSARLFGEMCDFYDFEIENYRNLLWRAEDVDELVEGLREISPFADDLLAIAETMTSSDLRRFKKALSQEDCEEGKSKMPHRFRPLLLPKRFVMALLLAEDAQVPLGCALVRLMDQPDLF